MHAEEAIEFLGFGLYQKRLIFCACIVAVLLGTLTGSVFFLTYSPNYRCAIPGHDNDTFNPVDDDHRYLMNRTLPAGKDKLCYVLGANSTFQDQTLPYNKSMNDTVDEQHTEMTKCNRWVYDKSVFASTIVTEYNFVCGGAIRIAHTRMMYFAGFLVGSFLFGLCGDLFGRKSALFTALALLLVSCLIIPWISNAESYMALLLLVGAGSIGTYTNTFVLLTEFMDKRKRILAVTLICVFYVAGLLYSVPIAYLIHEWRFLQLVYFCPFVLTLLSFFFTPESIRWLMRHGHHKKANDILRKVAKTNKVEVPEVIANAEESVNTKDGRFIMIKVITTPVLLKRFLIVVMNWVAVAMAYFGLTMNSGNITGNVFAEFALSSFVEAPAYILVMILIKRKGRKLVHMTLIIVGGLSCVSTILPVVVDKEGLQPLTVALATIGKFLVSAAFQSIYIYTPELFPTSTRMSVLGVCSCLGRIGAIVAPYCAELGKLLGGNYSTVIPLLIFGGIALFAGSLCIMLPETKGVHLPETVEDAKQISRKCNSYSIYKNGVHADNNLLNEKLSNGLHSEQEAIL